MDLYSRKIVGWAMSERIDTALTLDALQMALSNRTEIRKLIFHSFKMEGLYPDIPLTKNQARSIVFDYIEIFYNRQRRHSSLGYLSPWEFEQKGIPA
ncbi:MAG: hypothetical protein A3I11_00915 [Elusimicrobia bacterium RIFCSPLOWO2_02_FULL_39_32]|nr:MAG: hypothetical protein A2034_00660 [Elusimicrobia bacterium GWA2_38_7]OGR79002.1 MAG: hypothetical protein A3B80_07940 [Elusimicrobia bacterium RIFCSPHIGHO2_02_FULL_39_36]OGR92586.1 MAG: hypothetical protein A3I11_00915 [Elusimicrobia bacterium RIFCSPLOWO2_02_FULL_39_32]OGR99233.1 MAG: hypothetical protein A3G85_06125 [Elusimicrobia bacterium RIFCSPLOWO2_12_FULL_39_28]